MTKQPSKGYLHNDGVECCNFPPLGADDTDSHMRCVRETEGLAGYWPGGGSDTPCGGLAQPIYSNLRRYSDLLTDVCSNWSCTHLGLVVDVRNIQEFWADEPTNPNQSHADEFDVDPFNREFIR